MANNSGNTRVSKVAEQVQKELARLIQFEMKDPRLGFVTVSGVKVSRDFAHAAVYISVLGSSESSEKQAQDDSLEALTSGAGYLRSELAKVIRLRTVPRLKFHYDNTTQEGNRMSALIDKAIGDGSQTDNS